MKLKMIVASAVFSVSAMSANAGGNVAGGMVAAPSATTAEVAAVMGGMVAAPSNGATASQNVAGNMVASKQAQPVSAGAKEVMGKLVQ